MLYAVIWIGSIASYALAMHLGASENMARLILVVVLAETFISWAFARETEKRNREAMKTVVTRTAPPIVTEKRSYG